MIPPVHTDADLWRITRAGARAGRGFRYQDATAAWLVFLAWEGSAPWTYLIPEGLDDLTLHGADVEIRAQLKSKHDPRGTFTCQEAAEYLAKSVRGLPGNWREQKNIRLALVFERPLDGIAATGWNAVLDDTMVNQEPLRGLLRRALETMDSTLVDEVLHRTHLIVEPNPIEKATDCAGAVPLPPIGVRLLLQQLRELAGAAADANYLAPSHAPHTLDRSDVQRQIDGLLGTIDLSQYLDLTQGLAEIADFGAEVPCDAFYQGVNVMPGHVGLGLVFPRSESTTQVLSGLDSHRQVLIAGPSGSGKSALAWLVAYHTRHEVRWYRVRSLEPGNVAKLTRLSQFLGASSHKPVGFVIDDVGGASAAGWDALTREIASVAGVLAIGTVREEDLFTLQSAWESPVVRPQVDEELAERLWDALTERSELRFSHWREPFELSNGLLLEYVHLLVAGERLGKTLREQVRRRLSEGRDDELMVLRVSSFAASVGANVSSERLRTIFGWDELRFSRTLQRLVDEHTVRVQSDGSLIGLHEIRSTHLDHAIAELLNEPRSRVIAVATQALSPDSCAVFITRTLRLWPEYEDTLIESLKARLVQSADVKDWISALYGLGLATADRVAHGWLSVTREMGIEDRLSSTVFILALLDPIPDGEFFEKGRLAKQRFDTLRAPDLRGALLSRLGTHTRMPDVNLRSATALVATLLPLWRGDKPLYLRPNVEIEPNIKPLADALSLLAVLREIDVDVAQTVVDEMGGSEVLLTRICQERPWITQPETFQEDNVVGVKGYVRFIHSEVQPNLERDVFDLCTAMAAAVPRAELIQSDVLLTDGSSFGYAEYYPHRKRMQRIGVTTEARVACNRAQLRAIQRLVASPNESGRVKMLAEAIQELSVKVAEVGDLFCRKKAPDSEWHLFMDMRGFLTNMIPPSAAPDNFTGPLERGALSDEDSIHGFVTELQGLAKELASPLLDRLTLLAVRTSRLTRQASSLRTSNAWRLTYVSPLRALDSIHETLKLIRAVIGDAAMDPSQRDRAALRFGGVSRRHSVLARAANEALARAQNAADQQSAEIRDALRHQGVEASIFRQDIENDEGYFWPAMRYAAVVPAQNVVEWLTTEQKLREAIATLKGSPRLSYGLALNGQLAPMAFIYIQTLLPDEAFISEWREVLPYPAIQSEALTLFDSTVDLFRAMSSIRMHASDGLSEVELAIFNGLIERWEQYTRRWTEIAREDSDPALDDAVSFLLSLAERLEAEHSGEPSTSLASTLVSVLHGGLDETTSTLLAVRIGLIERAALASA
jgi:adenylate kinase family enzyme